MGKWAGIEFDDSEVIEVIEDSEQRQVDAKYDYAHRELLEKQRRAYREIEFQDALRMANRIKGPGSIVAEINAWIERGYD